MKIDDFWGTWPTPQSWLYRIFLLLFGSTMVYFVVQFFLTPSLLINWQTETDIRTVKTIFERYYVGLYAFPIQVENYLALQTFLPGMLVLKSWPSMVHLMLFSLGLVSLLALSTTLRRFYYIVAMVGIAAIFLYLNIDILMLFGRYTKTGLIAALLVFFPASYYIHSYKSRLPLHHRFAIFLGLMLLYAIFIAAFAGVQEVAMHVSNYGMYPALILSLIFILMVGHEPYSTFLRLITNTGPRGGRHLLHFLVISFIYLLNVLLVYLRNSRDLDLGIYTINAYWLLLFAAILGIWGYRRRSPTYAGIFPFRPTGALLYLSLGVISFSTIAYLMARGQDSMLEAVEDAITFSQLGYGAMFILYVVANFYTELYRNININARLYKPPRMPYFISKFAGVIVILGLFLRSNLVPYYQAISGYHSGLGDVYFMQEDYAAAKEYYKIAGNYSSKSHRANYALATIAETQQSRNDALLYYRQSVAKNPTEYAYSKIARMYWLKDRYFDAIFTLREGLKMFPDSGPLLNNLGVLYSQTDVNDSTLYFLQEAERHSMTRETAIANRLAVYCMKNASLGQPAVIDDIPEANTLAVANNKAVYAALTGQSYTDATPVLFHYGMKQNTEQLLYNYNKALLDPLSTDTSFLRSVTQYYDTTGMAWMLEPLQAAGALASFARGDKTTAYERLYPLSAKRSRSGAYYSQLLGKLSLSSGAPQLAAQYFEQSASLGLLKAVPEYTFSLMESGDDRRAVALWQQILNMEDTAYHAIARNMLQVLQEDNPRNLVSADPILKYHFVRYRHEDFEPALIDGIILSLDNENYRAMAYIDLALQALSRRDADAAARHFGALERLSVNSAEILSVAHESIALYYIQENDLTSLQDLYNTGKLGEGPVRTLSRACLADFQGDYKTATELFGRIGFRDPFFEPGVLQAARFYNDEQHSQKRAYEMLLNAVNINPYAIRINEAYILQCLRLGLDNYAQTAMEKYRQIAPPAMLSAFMKAYNREREKLQQEYENW